jgi:Rrf2 family protein
MFLSKSVVHGVYVLCFLSRQPPDSVTSASAIAAAMDVPPEHASKILQALTSAGLLTSLRGRSGGYGLARRLSDVSVLDVLEALEPPVHDHGLQARPCPMAPLERCQAHEGLVNVLNRLHGVLREQTLASVLGSACQREDSGAGEPADDASALSHLD